MKLTKEELAKYAIKEMTNPDYANKNNNMIIEMITKAIKNQQGKFNLNK